MPQKSQSIVYPPLYPTKSQYTYADMHEVSNDLFPPVFPLLLKCILSGLCLSRMHARTCMHVSMITTTWHWNKDASFKWSWHLKGVIWILWHVAGTMHSILIKEMVYGLICFSVYQDRVYRIAGNFRGVQFSQLISEPWKLDPRNKQYYIYVLAQLHVSTKFEVRNVWRSLIHINWTPRIFPAIW